MNPTYSLLISPAVELCSPLPLSVLSACFHVLRPTLFFLSLSSTQVMTRRDLRPDTTMDKLIELIYGDVDKFEQQEEQYIERLNSSFNRQNMTESIERGQQRQETIRKKIERQLKAVRKFDFDAFIPIFQICDRSTLTIVSHLVCSGTRSISAST